jgi:hypothetical protein
MGSNSHELPFYTSMHLENLAAPAADPVSRSAFIMHSAKAAARAASSASGDCAGACATTGTD